MKTKSLFRTYLKTLLLLLIGYSNIAFSQQKVIERKSKSPIKDSVNLSLKDTRLSPVIFWAKPVFKDLNDRRRFLYIKRKVYKVWPYVQMAKKIYLLSQVKKQHLKRRRSKRRYVKRVRDSLMDKYRAKLKKFSRTDGRVMMKLIHRQTGKTTYNIIKESKSGWSAFWWNAKAGIFKLNLKDTLDVKNNRDDYFIEYITNEGILNGSLKKDSVLLN